MKNLLHEPRFTRSQQKQMMFVGAAPVLSIYVIINVLTLIINFLKKHNKGVNRVIWFTLTITGLLLAFTTDFSKPAYAPYANASEPQHELAPLPEREKNIELIKRYFGQDADQAIKVFTCESGLRTNAVNNNNKDGYPDVGIAQIHVFPTDPFTEEDMKNPYANLAEAKHKFDTRGWQPWDSSKGCWK